MTILCLVLLSPIANAYTTQNLNMLLNRIQPDDGVIIEIMTWSTNWNDLIDLVNPIVDQIKQISESIDIVIVSHGGEQFKLTKKNLSAESLKANKGLSPITRLESLSKSNKITISVCGAYSGMQSFDNDRFAPFINVADSGPALINDYLNLDYHHLTIP